MALFNRKLLAIFIASQVVGCGKNLLETEQSDGKNQVAVEDIEIADGSPTDSSGVAGSVTVGFHSENSAALSLAEENSDAPVPAVVAAPAPIKIGDKIVISTARFSIAKIKVKAAREVSADEERAEKAEKMKDDAEDRDYEKRVRPDMQDSMGRGKSKDSVLAKIKEHKAECSAKDEERLAKDIKLDRSIKFRGPYIYDAVAGKFEGVAPKVDLKDGSYRRVEFQMKRNHAAADSDPILGHSFIIRGTAKIGEKDVPLEISYHISENFRLRGDGAFAVSPEEDNELAIIFNMAKWFDGLDLSKAAIAEGRITVDKMNNKEILHALKANIKKHIRFGKALSRDAAPAAVVTAGVGAP